MALAPGTKLGPYEIQSPLGAGGMGEVYRARDVRLGRTVAVKILPQHLSANADLRQRFEREAKSISSLQHPNICTLFDVGQQEGIDFLVMEYLEGETLAERLKRGPLPFEQVLKTGIEISSALDKAHHAAIIHRDLKPGNIMLTKSGAKLLDFGLAKPAAMGAIAGTGPAPLLSATVTMTSPNPQNSPLTSAGMLVGTIQYMSPEQLRGREADACSDIFSYGAVLYEMATGRRAFQGKSQLSVATAILEKEPEPIRLARLGLPAVFEHVVTRSLAKEPEERWQSAKDICAELQWIAEAPAEESPPTSRATPARRFIGLVAGVLLIALAAGLGYWFSPSGTAPDLRVAINLPPGYLLDTIDTALVLSPDGTRLAFAAQGPEGPQRLWLRALNGQEPQALAGTEDATYPFWSPDGRYLGFFARRKLRTIDISTGAVRTLCDVQKARGASWSSRGVIVFAPDYATGLFSIPASGGTPVQLTTPKANGSHRFPFFLPDGRHVLFFSDLDLVNDKSGQGIYALDVDSGKTQLVAPEKVQPVYAKPGFLMFVRNGNLMAQPFSAQALKTTGQAALVAEDVNNNPDRGSANFSVAGNGTLVYAKASAFGKLQLTLFDGDGQKLADVGPPMAFDRWRIYSLSADGRQVATAVYDSSSNSSIWVFDVNGSRSRRLTFGAESRSSPVWSPDGSQLAYSDPDGNIYVQAANDSTPPRMISRVAEPRSVSSWSPDGRQLALSTPTKSGLDIHILSTSGEKDTAFLAGPAWETQPTFSPDGKWMAYVSDETGKFEIYIVSFPSPETRVQVSSGGGSYPLWISAGRELAYVTGERKVIAVEVKRPGTRIEMGQSRPLFGGRPLPVMREASNVDTAVAYMTPDAKRFLLSIPTTLSSPTPIDLRTNWASELESKR